MELGIIKLRRESDILSLRHIVKQVAEIMGFESLDSIRVAAATSELTRVIYEYASGGAIIFKTSRKMSRSGLQLIFDAQVDDGKEIKHLLSKDSFQLSGIQGARELVDDFNIAPSATGVKIEITKWLAAGITVNTGKYNRIRELLNEEISEDSLKELKSQNRELINVLDVLNEKNKELQILNKELEETNSGIITLYQELDKKNEQLDLKNERKNKFMRALGHETRTPISSIISLVRLLSSGIDGKLNSEQEIQVNLINENGKYLLNLINDLLDLSKIEDGFVQYRSENVNLSEIISKCQSILLPLAQEKGLDLKVEGIEEELEIVTDVKHLTQVLLNIAGNAIKYTDEGEVCIRVDRVFSDKRKFLQIEVNDTGIGIPEDKLGVIFDQFQRVYSRDDIVKGSGLGLAIAKNIIEDWGGSIEVSSVLGQGSRFRFLVPEELKSSGSEVKYIDAIRRKTKDTVLVVSNNVEQISFLKRIIRLSGFNTQVAHDNDEALLYLRKSEYYMVIQEKEQLDTKKSWKLLKTLKYDENLKHIPLIFIIKEDKDLDRAYSYGADIVLKQPITKKGLVEIIQDYYAVKKLKKILIIDDDLSSKQLLGLVFSEKMKIDYAKDGKEGLKKLETFQPDLVILDLIMPVMDGFEFIEKINAEKKYEDLPIIVYSSRELSVSEAERIRRFHTVYIDKSEVIFTELVDKLPSIFAKLIKGGRL